MNKLIRSNEFIIPLAALVGAPLCDKNKKEAISINLTSIKHLMKNINNKNKIKMYKQQVKRVAVKKEFSDIEDYLASLELKMTIFEDDESIIPRMSQMSQKTNQFNLTTNRYAEGDIKSFIENDNSKIIAFSVSDKFGDSGVTGLCIINFHDETQSVEIDTLLMSCRIIGRNIELIKTRLTLEFGRKINVNQKGNTPKLSQR